MKPFRFQRMFFVQQLNQRFTLYATLVVLTVLTAGFVIVINPEISAIRSFGVVSLQQSRAERESVAETLRLTKSIVESYRSISGQNREKLTAILPQSADLPAMFVEVDAIALSSGLQLNNLSFTVTAPARGSAAQGSGAGLQQLQVTFDVTGGRGYQSLKNFLSTVESNVRLLDVQSLSYNPTTSKEETYTINAVTYYKGQ